MRFNVLSTDAARMAGHNVPWSSQSVTVGDGMGFRGSETLNSLQSRLISARFVEVTWHCTIWLTAPAGRTEDNRVAVGDDASRDENRAMG